MNNKIAALTLLDAQRKQIEASLKGLITEEELQHEINKVLEAELVTRTVNAISVVPQQWGDSRALKIGRAQSAMTVFSLYLENQAVSERAGLLANSGE